MKIKITVEVQLAHLSGMFAGREDMEARLIEAIREAIPATLTGGSGRSDYAVTAWEISGVPKLLKVDGRRRLGLRVRNTKGQS